MQEFIDFVMVSGQSEKAAKYKGVATMIKGQFPKLQNTLDAYNQGPQSYGAAYKISGDQIEAIAQFLQGKGFTRKGNNMARDNILVEMGKDKLWTYLYISDDN